MKLSWLYQPVNIPDVLLNIFQKEFMLVYDKFVTDLESHPIQLVSEENISIIPTHYPYLFRYLKLLGIHSYIVRIGLVVLNESKVVVHTDWPATGYALNIPVLNCQGTFTAWYDAQPTKNRASIYSSNSWKAVGDSPLYDSETAIEIDRIEANKPHWINVHVPHSPVCNHNKLRVNGTIRFDDRIYNYLETKYPN